MLKGSAISKIQPRRHSTNSFNLPPILSCPGKTPICARVCYARKNRLAMPKQRKLMMENWNRVNELSNDGKQKELVEELIEIVTRSKSKIFRWFSSGDIFSLKFAEVLRIVMLQCPDVSFWMYTRSIYFIEPLRDVPNLSLYLSIDRDNWLNVLEIHGSGTRLAYMMIEYEKGKPIFNKDMKDWMICRQANGELPLQNACNHCRICINGESNVIFPVH